MKKLYLRLLLFLILLCSLDFAVGCVSDYLIKNPKSGQTEKISHICDNSSEDVLVFGSSRGVHHYDPTILGDSLGMTVYNSAYDGCGSILLYGLLNVLTQHYTPKCIVYDVQPSFDYLYDGQDNNRFLSPLKLYYDRPGVDSIFRRIDPTERWKMLSKMYRINGKLIQVVSESFMVRNQTIQGYLPVDKKMEIEPAVDRSEKKLTYDETKKYYFEKIIQLCRDKHIRLVFFASPYYKNTSDSQFAYVKSVAKKYGIPFYDFSCDRRYVYKKDWFYDSVHMNVHGATEYSKEVGGILRKSLQNI